MGDPMDAREVLTVIQGNIEVKCSVGGPLVCPHPEKLSIDCIADLEAYSVGICVHFRESIL